MLYSHERSTIFAKYLGYFFRNFDPSRFFLNPAKRFDKWAVELFKQFAPFHFALSDVVQAFFHRGREIDINDFGEMSCNKSVTMKPKGVG